MNWLKNIRQSKGLKQYEVAEMCGFSYQLYSHFETGRRVPKVEAAKKIAAVLGFDWTRFYEDEQGVNNEVAPTGTTG